MRLNIDDLSFDYSSKEVLRDVGFEARHGEVLGILGENGCGKTTLLKCINKLLKQKSGCVYLSEMREGILDPKTEQKYSQDGSVTTDDLSSKEIARSMAVVKQSEFISFPFTSLEAVKMGRYANNASNTPEEEIEIVYRAMRDAGALEFADRYVNELSGGELRRVMIARALAQEADILLLDEPTLHLDVCHQFDLMELVRKLTRERDLLVVMVTHDIAFAGRYCDRLIMMEKGKIVHAGPTEDVLTVENIRDIFHVEAEIAHHDKVEGLLVTMIGRAPRP